MSEMRGFIRACILAIALAVGANAQAATTVFGADVFSETSVTGAPDALGVADGTAGLVGAGGELVLEFDDPVTGLNIMLEALDTGPASTVAISIGHVIGGVAVFSAETNFVENSGGTFTFDLSAECSGISANGCGLLRIRRVSGPPAGSFALDGITGATPEPATWMMMIIGFIFVAWRLKVARREERQLSFDLNGAAA